MARKSGVHAALAPSTTTRTKTSDSKVSGKSKGHGKDKGKAGKGKAGKGKGNGKGGKGKGNGKGGKGKGKSRNDDDDEEISEEDGVFDESDQKKYGDTIDTVFERMRKQVQGSDNDKKDQSDDEDGSDEDGSDGSEENETEFLHDIFSSTGVGSDDDEDRHGSSDDEDHQDMIQNVLKVGKTVNDVSKVGKRFATISDNEQPLIMGRDLSKVTEGIDQLIDDSDDEGVSFGELMSVLGTEGTTDGGTNYTEDKSDGKDDKKSKKEDLKSDASIQKKLQRLNDMEKAEPLMSEVKQARVERNMAYEAASKDAKKWDRQVQANREAKQLLYGDYENLLQNRSIKNLVTADRISKDGKLIGSKEEFFKTRENSISIQESAESNNEKTLTFEEELALAVKESNVLEEIARESNKLSIQETEENKRIKDARSQQQISHLRALMVRELARAKRLKKIKSKSFHRVKRRMENREKEKILKKLELENPELAADLRREMEEKLAQTRNRRSADARKKWAKAAQRFGGKDMRSEISKQAQRAEDEKKALIRALKGKGDDESDSDIDLSDEEMDPLEKAEYLAQKELEESLKAGELQEKQTKGLFGMQFMKNAMSQKRELVNKQASDLLKELDEWKRIEKGEDRKKKRTRDGADFSESEENSDEENSDDHCVDNEEDSSDGVEDSSDDVEDSNDEDLSKEVSGEKGKKSKKTSQKSSKKSKKSVSSKKSTNITMGNSDEEQESDEEDSENEESDEEAITKGNKYTKSQLKAAEKKLLASGLIEGVAVSSSNPNTKSQISKVNGAIAIDTKLNEKEELKMKRKKEMDNEKSAKKRKKLQEDDDKIKEHEESDDEELEISDETFNPFETVDNELKNQTGANLIKAAFAESNTTENDFYSEIQDKNKRKLDKLEEETSKFQGWGSWAGIGIHNIHRKEDEEKKLKVAIELEKMNKKNHTYYKNIDKKFSEKYEVQNMPHPFSCKEQYELSLAAASGSEWNTGSVHKYKVQPKIVTRLGAVVKPLEHIKHANVEQRDEMLSAWSKSKKPIKPKARF